jgi:hypothetical protein
MITLNIPISYLTLLRVIEDLPLKEKYKLSEILERDLLSEFEDYDNSHEVKNNIQLSMSEYKKGNFKTLAQLEKK